MPMPALYIKDEDVADMAEKLRAATRAPSKTEAVRRALEQALERLERPKTVAELIAPALSWAADIGPAKPGFNYKDYFSDEDA